MDLKDIKKIVELMNEHGLSQFKLEQDDTKLEMKKGADLDIEAVRNLLASQAAAAPFPTAAPAAMPAAPAGGTSPAEDALPADTVEIVSPMVGTFYSAPAPDADPFVAIGSRVQADTTVCIVEAMKVMNQISADVSGEIVEILVENGNAVQYGEPLFRVKTA